MNTVNLNSIEPEHKPPQSGAFYQHADGTLYILTTVADGWQAFSLDRGIRWDSIKKTPAEATEGLDFLCNSARIDITPID